MSSGYLRASVAAFLLAASAPQALLAQAQPANEASAEAAAKAKFAEMDKQLHPQGGRVQIAPAHVTLDLGSGYYFLPSEDAKRVLTEGWGNPPDQVANVLGMVFPAGKTFHDQTWGAVIQYQDTGHVSDKDAAKQDYDSVLSDMRSGEEADNEQAKKAGYATSHLVGWAQAPTYDAATKTLIWARNIQFDGQDENTLNYDVRTLGRTGVLSLNMVDSMSNLSTVREAAKGLGSTVKFDSGSSYADYNPSTDKLADYGLAGLVAAGAGLAVAQKAGFLAVVAIFFKKAIALIIGGAVAARAWFKRKFGRKDELAVSEGPAEEAPASEV